MREAMRATSCTLLRAGKLRTFARRQAARFSQHIDITPHFTVTRPARRKKACRHRRRHSGKSHRKEEKAGRRARTYQEFHDMAGRSFL
ncbi:hypothetical protein J8I26_00165 [Herbaspirillum sp. LeCh32-8]|uniref:hypothetical protein n=1 Tax=Herbaspirillum sp. LeCh32-8 TaxID=2821356 RepID=UPI001AE4DCBF|nr:hypothetical protein [Herbaspirillum sp. LeCh32-8]MBP0596506.1 hypothetical protein [Herbaspirillum sp. LeCh32-8]